MEDGTVPFESKGLSHVKQILNHVENRLYSFFDSLRLGWHLHRVYAWKTCNDKAEKRKDWNERRLTSLPLIA
jgi:hypothetical protein